MKTKSVFNENLNNNFPFFWLTGGETPDQIESNLIRIKELGCGGVTVEPRGFADFETEWWEKIDFILDKCENLGLKVIVVDEDSCPPTGHAFGLVGKKGNESLQKTSLVEAHLDVVGPASYDFVVGQTSVYAVTENKDELIGVYAYRRTDKYDGVDVTSVVDLSGNVKSGLLHWEVPEGNFRIFYFFKTKKYVEIYRDAFVDFLNKDSVALLVENIYDEYERRYAKYFGKTLIGFFSDEPAIGGTYKFEYHAYDPGYYNTRIGVPGQAIPYTQELKNKLDEVYGFDCCKLFAALWFWDENISPKLRNEYMNIVSALYRDNFSATLARWCEKRGLIYLGHVLEDNNLHCRYGHGAGHYFRSQENQNMPGIDIVMHQVMPGLIDYEHTGTGAHLFDADFYSYILGKLASSAAHTYPQFDGKALCEVTIGYGWAEGAQLVKWLFDYLLVRGTNFFVPGAQRPVFPDNVHAPHFGAQDGKEPQFKAFKKIIGYANRVSGLLSYGTHIANACILYHAQAEWMSGEEYELDEKAAKNLYEHHIDFDLLSEDLLDGIEVKEGKIHVNGERFDCLVVPYAKYLPDNLLNSLNRLKSQGADVVFTNGLPLNCGFDFNCVETENLYAYFYKNKYTDVRIEGANYLRHYHYVKDGKDIYMFFNESTTQTFRGYIKTGKRGNCNVYDYLNEEYFRLSGNDGFTLNLQPYSSVIVMYEEDRGFTEYIDFDLLESERINVSFDVTLKNCVTDEVKTLRSDGRSPISETYPDFSGFIEYDGSFSAQKREKVYLQLGDVGECAEVFLNGESCGMKVCGPFRYDITEKLKEGQNTLKILVSTTLANALQDPVSMYVPLAPTGISGGLKLLYK